MRRMQPAILFSIGVLSLTVAAQRVSTPQPAITVTAAAANLPFEPIGVSDLVHLNVADSPELSQSFRVDEQGNLNLPLLQAPIHAQGLLPSALQHEITAALKAQHLLVNPTVDVSMVEYRSRSVTIAGAVKTPATIQEVDDLHVLSALSQAGGLTADAGAEIFVEQPNQSVQRLAVKDLFDGRHPELNLPIASGTLIRVPQADQVYVVGNVKRPGAFPFHSVEDTTVLQLLALSGGLDAFTRHTAYIYRTQPGTAQKKEIEVPLRRILSRKSEDVRLTANDILYVPINDGLKASATVLRSITGIGNTAVSAAIWSSH